MDIREELFSDLFNGKSKIKEKITVVNIGDDWVAVYLEDKLIQEGHSVREDDLLRKLGYSVEYKDIKYKDGDITPSNLKDLK